jgi:uncharacterized repeat protein (TIGR01451 family)
MKNHYTGVLLLLTLFISASSTLAQNVVHHSKKIISLQPAGKISQGAPVYTASVNYNAMNYVYNVENTASNIMLYLWNINARYTPAEASLTNIGTSFIDFVDTNDVAFTPIGNIYIDKLSLMLTHENNSGLNDTLIIYVQDVDQGTGYPSGPVLWSDTMIIATSLSPGGNWVGQDAIFQWDVFPPAGLFAAGKFFVGFDYYGDFTDTCAIVAGFDDIGISPQMALEAPYGKVYKEFSDMSPGLWPDVNGNDLYYDNNFNGQYDIGTGEANFLQALWLTAFVHDNASLITGTVFDDLNNNNIQDAGEPGVFNRIVTAGQYAGLTDISGHYAIPVDTGNYWVAVASGYYSTTPSSVNVQVTALNQVYANNDMALHFMSSIQDLRVTATEITPPRPGFDHTYVITYENTGTTIMSGTVKFAYDNVLGYVGASPVPSQINGNTLEWSFANLLPFEHRNVQLTVSCPATTPLGTILNDSAWVEPFAGDTTVADNTDTLNLVVVGAYDPNDKTPEPAGTGAQGFINSSQELTYRIRFQNTGTYYATNVFVEDTIDTDLDLSTFKMLSASHNYTYTINGRLIRWTFSNIMLPDSNTNEPASHGFIKYSIKPNWFIPMGETIHNTAYIYFDFNAAVITNTTLNTINIVTSNAGVPGAYVFENVYPNPASDIVSFVTGAKPGERGELVLSDITGKVLNRVMVDGNEVKLDVSRYERGMYIYSIKMTSGKVHMGKLLIQ